MEVDYSVILGQILEALRGIVFLIGFANGIVFMGLFGKRWFF